MQSGTSNVLVVGSGGREHALVWKLAQSRLIGELYVAPGNGGTAQYNVPIHADDIPSLAQFAKSKNCFTIVGPEIPLAAGIVDHFLKNDLAIFGPTKEQSKLEWSKTYAKEFMQKNNIPTAPHQTFTDSNSAMDFAEEKEGRVVIKADGLAAGKGVFVCSTFDEAKHAIHSIMDEKIFGESGNRVLVEEKLEGREVSLMTLADGRDTIPFGTATDHKRVGDGDRGPNTGGMGAYSPALNLSESEIDELMKTIAQPTVRNSGFKGFLYVGLMLTEQGGKVIEFNSRLGDPETQVILPRLESDLLEVILHLDGNDDRSVKDLDLVWKKDSCCTVAMCSEGYPAKPRIGDEIKGIEKASALDRSIIFHSGTVKKDGKIYTNGGRVLSVTAMGQTLVEARVRAYSAVDLISWKGEHHRRDIGSLKSVE